MISINPSAVANIALSQSQLSYESLLNSQAMMMNGGNYHYSLMGLPAQSSTPNNEVLNAALKEIERLREALAFYADKNNWLGSTFMPANSFHSRFDDHASDKAATSLEKK